jgi:hypothetical protein
MKTRTNGEMDVNSKGLGGYTHIPKRQETINSNPNTIRAITIKATAVITP